MESKLQKARTDLLFKEVFFGSLALRPEYILTEEVPTAATNGKAFMFNPKFIKGLNRYEMEGLLAHEICHDMLLHSLRMGDKDPARWNQACDYAINLILSQHKFVIPEGGLLDPKYEGMMAEEIYNILPEGEEGGGGGQGIGEVLPFPDSTSAELKEAENEMKIAVRQAANAAKVEKDGKLSAELERLIGKILQPIIDWREVLRRFITDNSKNDYSWAKPNRRFIASGLYLPSLYTQSLGELNVIIDTSGSITDAVLAEFQAELNGILEQTKPRLTRLIYADARVNKVEEYSAHEAPVTLRAYGGGGTDFRPAFEHLKKLNSTAPTVYLTDLFGEEPKSTPGPTIWICTSAKVAKTGLTVPYRRKP